MGKLKATGVMIPHDNQYMHALFLCNGKLPGSYDLQLKKDAPKYSHLIAEAIQVDSTQSTGSPYHCRSDGNTTHTIRCTTKRTVTGTAQYNIRATCTYCEPTSFNPHHTAHTTTVTLVRYQDDNRYYADIRKDKIKGYNSILEAGQHLSKKWHTKHSSSASPEPAETKRVVFLYQPDLDKFRPVYILYQASASFTRLTAEFVEALCEINADENGPDLLTQLCQQNNQQLHRVMEEFADLAERHSEEFPVNFPKCFGLFLLYLVRGDKRDVSRQHHGEPATSSPRPHSEVGTCTACLNSPTGAGTITFNEREEKVFSDECSLRLSQPADSYHLKSTHDKRHKLDMKFVAPIMQVALIQPEYQPYHYNEKTTGSDSAKITTESPATIDGAGSSDVKYSARITHHAHYNTALGTNFGNEAACPAILVTIIRHGGIFGGAREYTFNIEEMIEMKNNPTYLRDTLESKCETLLQAHIISNAPSSITQNPDVHFTPLPVEVKLGLYLGAGSIATHRPIWVTHQAHSSSSRIGLMFIEASPEIAPNDAGLEKLSNLCKNRIPEQPPDYTFCQIQKRIAGSCGDPERIRTLFPKCFAIATLMQTKRYSEACDKATTDITATTNEMIKLQKTMLQREGLLLAGNSPETTVVATGSPSPLTEHDPALCSSPDPRILDKYQYTIRALGVFEQDSLIAADKNGQETILLTVIAHRDPANPTQGYVINGSTPLALSIHDLNEELKETCPNYIEQNFPKCWKIFVGIRDSEIKTALPNDIVPTHSGDLTAATPDEDRNRAVSADTGNGIDNELISTASTLLDNATLASSSHCQSRHGSSKKELGGNDDGAEDSVAISSTSSLNNCPTDSSSVPLGLTAIIHEDKHDTISPTSLRPDSALLLSSPLATDNKPALSSV